MVKLCLCTLWAMLGHMCTSKAWAGSLLMIAVWPVGWQVVAPHAAEAGLLAGDPIKNARAILRYALPIDNKEIRQVQVG